jgi:tetratricopeptide (TPR) repeat protein
MPHTLRTLAAFTLLILVASACHPSRPASTAVAANSRGPCTVALAPGTERTDRDREIGRVQAAARGAHQREGLERLGYLFVARARTNNDPGDYRLAEATANCLESKYPNEPAALLLRGHVMHQLHRFQEAERIARLLVARRTFFLDYGLLGDALMEQGRLNEAAQAYQQMSDLKPYYQSYTRAAHLRWLKGDLDGAIELIRLAIKSASPRDPESSAWAWTRLAAYELQRRRFGDASRAVDAALGYQPDYAAALLTRGRILLAMDRAADAIEPLRRAARLNPLPEYKWTLADALRLEGRDGEAFAVEKELEATGAVADPRTFALYLATRRVEARKAIALAEEELQVRGDVFTLDAKAWALAAGGELDEARELIQRATAEGTHDARLFLHAGVIHAAAGQPREARRWLKKANTLRAMLLPSESAELTRHLTN